jgi:predicted Zn-dependent protease
MSYPVYMGAMQAYMNGVPMMFLKFSRSAEAEADYLGIQYMYKAGYDPDSYVTFFGKLIDQDRRTPGSVPTIFASHPPTPERVLKSEVAIKEVLPKQEQYLVSTSEFDDVKSRLQMVISNRKRGQKEQSGPTLRKRESTEQTTTQTQQPSDKPAQTEDKPPVLRRRD